jgi:hypothetical protein
MSYAPVLCLLCLGRGGGGGMCPMLLSLPAVPRSWWWWWWWAGLDRWPGRRRADRCTGRRGPAWYRPANHTRYETTNHK